MGPTVAIQIGKEVMKKCWILFFGAGIIGLQALPVYGQPTIGFTQEDRERVIRLETTLTLFMEATDQRFEQVNQRFEQVDQRFEQVDQRFIELREDMNIRFIELREDMNKRFEQVDKRFEQMMDTLQLIAGIFTAMTLGVIGFAYWDRRTIIRKAKQETLATIEQDAVPKEEAMIERAVAQAVQEIKKDNRLQDLIAALRKLAATDLPLANVLKEFHLL